LVQEAGGVVVLSHHGDYAARMREHLVWARLPSAVPVTNAALYARYQLVLRRLVRRQVKYGISHVDAEGEVWMRLFQARVIDRYVLNRLVFDPSLSEAVFRRYLLAAARNHLKNIFRTLTRRSNCEKAIDYDLSRRIWGDVDSEN
jgi:hypothetical protein